MTIKHISIEAELAALRADNARLQAKVDASANRKLSLKVSAKGAVSLYGMGKFPVTLYAAQWERVLNDADAIREFIAANNSLLARK